MFINNFIVLGQFIQNRQIPDKIHIIKKITQKEMESPNRSITSKEIE